MQLAKANPKIIKMTKITVLNSVHIADSIQNMAHDSELLTGAADMAFHELLGFQSSLLGGNTLINFSHKNISLYSDMLQLMTV